MSFNKLVKRCLEESNNDPYKAATKMVAIVKKSRSAIYKDWVNEIIYKGCFEFCRDSGSSTIAVGNSWPYWCCGYSGD